MQNKTINYRGYTYRKVGNKFVVRDKDFMNCGYKDTEENCEIYINNLIFIEENGSPAYDESEFYENEY